jgi:4'-phosphopantetheinyl transferase EntD
MDFSLLKELLEINQTSSPELFQQKGLSQYSIRFNINTPLARDHLPYNKSYSLKRYNQFMAGRYCIHKNLNTKTIIKIMPFGAPKWPKGICGSITHCKNFASACCGKLETVRGIGIDSESIFDQKTVKELRGLIASQEEIKHSDLDLKTLLTLVFSAKESLYKAIFPITQSFFGYRDADFYALDLHKKTFKIKIKDHPFKGLLLKNNFQGSFTLAKDMVHTGIILNHFTKETL